MLVLDAGAVTHRRVGPEVAALDTRGDGVFFRLNKMLLAWSMSRESPGSCGVSSPWSVSLAVETVLWTRWKRVETLLTADLSTRHDAVVGREVWGEGGGLEAGRSRSEGGALDTSWRVERGEIDWRLIWRKNEDN